MNLIVLFGGISSEHSISCISASHVLRNLDTVRYDVYAVGITQDGRWYLCEHADPDKIESGEWEREALVPAVLSPDRGTHGLLISRGDEVEIVRVDCVFPVLHGIGGEDGTIQGLLALSGIPYVGCDTAASANCMDKTRTKIIAASAGLDQAAWCMARRADFTHDPEGVLGEVCAALTRFPLFVKAARGGSSIGVSRADDSISLREGLTECFRWDNTVIIEEFIAGHEIEVAVLGNDAPAATIAGEIAPTQEFYTFDAKYSDDSSALYIPAHISATAMDTVRAAALRVYRALGCQGLARVDFFCTYDDERIIFNEINTMPGFTGISMYPKLWADAGISYPALLDSLIALAMEASHG